MILMKVLYWKSEVQFIVRKENFCRLLNKNKNLRVAKPIFLKTHLVLLRVLICGVQKLLHFIW